MAALIDITTVCVWVGVGVIVWERVGVDGCVCGCDCVGESGSVWVWQP